MRTKSIIFITVVLLFFSVKSFGQSDNQSPRLKFIGFEASLNSFSGEIENTDKIRANISYFDSNSNGLTSSFSKSYTGVKGEIRSKNNQFAVSTGLRYTRISSSVGEGDGSASGFFYFLINNTGTTTEYLRIEEIIQQDDYLAVPIEFKYFPFQESLIRVYAKLDLEFAYAIQNQTEVTFFEPSMNLRKDEIIEKFGESNSFYSSITPAIGVKFGKENKPALLLELSIPTFFMSENISTLITPDTGIGFQFNLQIPLHTFKSTEK